MPSLSIITGAYNVAKCPHFDKSIRSILEQTFSDFEFIICDDGSSDETYSLLKQYADSDSRIILIQNEKNLGLVETLNKCLELATGKYVARHDCDDYNALDRFEKQVNYLEEHADVCILGSSAYLFDENGVWGTDIMPRKVESKNFLFNNPYKHGSVIFRREALLKAGGYRVAKETVRNEDYDLFMRMQAFCKGENLEEPLYFFCEDKLAQKRRKYRYRVNEAIVRYKGFKNLGLMPRAIPYVIKPLIVGLIPNRLLSRMKDKKRNNKNR
jgi:glycosyltransferase involved in cell wall biosynthesis